MDFWSSLHHATCLCTENDWCQKPISSQDIKMIIKHEPLSKYHVTKYVVEIWENSKKLKKLTDLRRSFHWGHQLIFTESCWSGHLVLESRRWFVSLRHYYLLLAAIIQDGSLVFLFNSRSGRSVGPEPSLSVRSEGCFKKNIF